MAFHADVQRITRSLNWIGAGALVLGIVVVVWALWWTRGVDDFRTAVIIAALGFGLPSLAALTLAWMLDPLTLAEAAPSVSAPTHILPKLMYRGMFEDWSVAAGYGAAVVAVLIAALARFALNPVLGESVPFITFFLAVAVAAWIGGFGPSALATVLGIAIAWRWQLQGDADLPPNQLSNVVAIGIFAAAVTGLITFFVQSGLPRLNYPLFEIRGFARASQDAFLLAVAFGSATTGASVTGAIGAPAFFMASTR